MTGWPFKRSRAKADAERLISAVIQIARQPNFYGEGRIPDTLEGRLEAMMLHAALAMIRLGREETLAPLAQDFADVLFSHFDSGLREAAVGDLAVPKRVHKIASAFYGRLEAYSRALAADDREGLSGALARNALNAEPGASPFAPQLAAYAAETVRIHAEGDVDRLFRLDGWAAAPA